MSRKGGWLFQWDRKGGRGGSGSCLQHVNFFSLNWKMKIRCQTFFIKGNYLEDVQFFTCLIVSQICCLRNVLGKINPFWLRYAIQAMLASFCWMFLQRICTCKVYLKSSSISSPNLLGSCISDKVRKLWITRFSLNLAYLVNFAHFRNFSFEIAQL